MSSLASIILLDIEIEDSLISIKIQSKKLYTPGLLAIAPKNSINNIRRIVDKNWSITNRRLNLNL